MSKAINSKAAPESAQDDPIFHVANGGTIDSVWSPTKDTAVPGTQSVIPTYLRDAARIPHPVVNYTPSSRTVVKLQ